MKIRPFLASLGLIAAGSVPAILTSSAGAASTVQLRVADAYTYSAGNDFDHTVCVDGDELTSLSTTDTNGPFAVASGDHEIKVVDGIGSDCTDDGDVFDVTIPEVQAATLMLYWPAQGQGLNVAVLPDDVSCTQGDEGRLIIRNAAAIYSESIGDPIDVDAAAPDSSGATLAQNVASGDQDVRDLPDGLYTAVTGYEAGTANDFLHDADLQLNPSVVTVRTYYGGADGDIGSFDATIKVGICETPTTTTTTPPTSVVGNNTTQTDGNGNAQAATAVAGTPDYTG